MMTISVAKILIGIQCKNGNFFDRIYNHYLSFHKSGKVNFKFHLFPDPNMPEIQTPLVLKKHDEDSYLLQGAMTGVISLKEGRAEVTLPPDPIAFDGLLRLILGALLLRKGGMLLHASGIVRKGYAWVFFGPSESGKTTITKLCPSDPILSDEIVAIRKNAKGQYLAYSTPFSGKWKSGKHLPPALLAALFSPVKSTYLSLEKIAPSDVVKLILPQVILPSEIQDLPQRALDNIVDIVDKIQCFSLNFKLGYPIGELIDKLAHSRVSRSKSRLAGN